MVERRIIGLPFKEKLEYFRRKRNISESEMRDLSSRFHDYAFSIAGITNNDVISDVRILMDKAIAEEQPFDEFYERFRSEVRDQSWLPKDDEKASSRVYKIWDTNNRQAHRAGRWEQIDNDNFKKVYPYMVWFHRDSVVPRPNHEALHLKAIPSDHRFWKIAMPSCGFGCRCGAQAANERMLNILGAKILTPSEIPDPYDIAEEGFRGVPGNKKDWDKIAKEVEGSRKEE